MCPVCAANAAMAIAGVTGTSGGVTAIAWRILRWTRASRIRPQGRNSSESAVVRREGSHP